MPDPEFDSRKLEKRVASRFLDVLIRAGLIVVVVILCYRVFAPFVTLTVWAIILAVTVYPLHRMIALRLGGRQWISATLLTLLGIVLIVAPTAVLMNSFGETLQNFIIDVQANTLQIPPPSDRVAGWPFIGPKLHDAWSRAHADLPALVQSLQPQIGELARSSLAFVGGIAGGLLEFLAAVILAGILVAFGEAGARGCGAFLARVAGKERGAELAVLSAATIRAVAQGVVGIALIQALLVGLCLLVAGVPWAGALAAIVLVVGIAQIPAVIVTLPAIAYIWTHDYGTGEAIFFTVLLLVAGMADNVLKPLLLARGVDVPMPVILVGALGGMAATGIIGMFVGATLLALGYQLFMGWVRNDPD